MSEIIDYTPPPTVNKFIKHYVHGGLFYNWIVGPVGSGKTTGLFMKLVYMAGLQKKGPDGIRRTRAVVVRNTASQLKDTTIKSWDYWFKDGIAGQWKATEKNFVLRFGDAECEVLFRPLDTPDDIARVLSLEVTFAILDEFVLIGREIVDALSTRLGRYPAKKDGGATNWGMWGASNPSTEDNWWFDYLHNTGLEVPVVEHFRLDEDPDAREVRIAFEASNRGDGDLNATYFLQPSGLGPDAENLENLAPYDGSNAYYTNQAKGKGKDWIAQFLEATWGFSAAGKPVVRTFNPDMHISKKLLKFNPHLPLIAGFDPGMGGSAFVFGQEDLEGRLVVLGELVQEGYGAERLCTDRVKPYLRRRFPDADFLVAPDPAAANRQPNDETSVVQVVKRYFPVKIETNNRLPLRLDAIDYFTTRLVDSGPALLIDEKECPMLCRALRGGWRFELTPKNDMQKPMPEKNKSSHVGDAFGYLARFFHRQWERGGFRGSGAPNIHTPPPSRPVRYHYR